MYTQTFVAILFTLFLACGNDDKTPAKENKPTPDNTKPPIGPPKSKEPIVSVPKQAGQKPIRLPGKLTPAPWLEGATRVVAVHNPGKDLPTPVVVAAGLLWLRWFDGKGNKLGERELSGGVQVLEAADVDGDGYSEIIVGSGRARGAVSAPIALDIINLDNALAERIPLPSTSRAQVVSVQPAPNSMGHLWVASYTSKFEVSVFRYARGKKGKWQQAESRGVHRVVGGMTVLAGEAEFGTPVIARLYGENADAPGGVYELLSETEEVAIPTLRGARAILAIPSAQNSADLVVADGWDKHYAKKAEGLISYFGKSKQAKADPSWQLRTRVKVFDNYGFQGLRRGEVHTNAGFEIVVSGNGPALVSLPARSDLLFSLGSAEAMDAFPIDLDGDHRDEVIIVGPSPAVWSAL